MHKVTTAVSTTDLPTWEERPRHDAPPRRTVPRAAARCTMLPQEVPPTWRTICCPRDALRMPRPPGPKEPWTAIQPACTGDLFLWVVSWWLVANGELTNGWLANGYRVLEMLRHCQRLAISSLSFLPRPCEGASFLVLKYHRAKKSIAAVILGRSSKQIAGSFQPTWTTRH